MFDTILYSRKPCKRKITHEERVQKTLWSGKTFLGTCKVRRWTHCFFLHLSARTLLNVILQDHFDDLDKGLVFELFFCFFLFLIRLVNSYLFIFCVCLCGLILSMFFQSSCCIVQCIIPNANCRPSCEHNLKDVLEVLFSSLIFFLIYLVRLRVNNSQYTMGFWWKMLYFLIPELSNDWK